MHEMSRVRLPVLRETLPPTYGLTGFRVRADGVTCLPDKNGKPGEPVAAFIQRKRDEADAAEMTPAEDPPEAA